MARIPLYSAGRIIRYALVDEEDAVYLRNYRWRVKDGYAFRSANGGTCYMHRVIYDLHCRLQGRALPEVVDHANGNRTDNTKRNLIGCTKAENNGNRSVQRRKKHSRYRGVTHCGSRYPKRPWRAYGGVNGRRTWLGNYATEKEAAKIAREWRKRNLPQSRI